MNAFGKFRFQKIIDGAVDIDACLAFEGGTRDRNREMCLPARSRTRVALVPMGIVGHGERRGLKGLAQFQFDPVAHRHRKVFSETIELAEWLCALLACRFKF